jgi:tRNA dimethylallyltransferase
MPHNAWILAGATATGKSAICQLLAERLGLSILSADSMLVYKGMDIGTAKPSAEERGGVNYYGIDLVTPDQPFSTGAWIKAARESLSAMTPATPGPLIVTGGTGLYIKALTSGIDSNAATPEIRKRWRDFYDANGIEALRAEIAERIPEHTAALQEANPRRLIRTLEHLDSSRHLPDNWEKDEHQRIVVLTMPREQLHSRILRRVRTMFDQGLLEEVQNLKARYPQWSETAAKAIGYGEALSVIGGSLSQAEAMERIARRTRQLAKRQETWFRHQHNAIWCTVDERDCIEETAEKVLSLWHEYGTTELKTE